MLTKRQLLLSLAALGMAAPAQAGGLDGIDPAGARSVGRAYLAAHPTAVAVLEKDLFPGGWSQASLDQLRGRIAADFGKGALFGFQGWRLSVTEARLMALLSQR